MTARPDGKTRAATAAPPDARPSAPDLAAAGAPGVAQTGVPDLAPGAAANRTIASPGETATAPPGAPRRVWPGVPLPAIGRRTWLAALGWVLAAAALFGCYLRISRTVPANSDGAANALQAWDMLHGNLLLHGWWLSDVSFYTTELPQYMLVELVHGLNSDVVHVAAAMTYTLLVLLAAVLAKGRTTGSEAAIRMLVAGGIMLAP